MQRFKQLIEWTLYFFSKISNRLLQRDFEKKEKYIVLSF